MILQGDAKKIRDAMLKDFQIDLTAEITNFIQKTAPNQELHATPFEFICNICESENMYMILQGNQSHQCSVTCHNCNSQHKKIDALGIKFLHLVRAIDQGPGK